MKLEYTLTIYTKMTRYHKTPVRKYRQKTVINCAIVRSLDQGNRNKEKINTRDLIKFTSFCTAKETINKTKRQPTDWDVIFANDATYKGLIFKIYK